MVSFIHNENEKATWMGCSFKIKINPKKTKQYFSGKDIFFEFKGADH